MRPRLTLTLAAILIHAAPAARPQTSAPTIQVYARETVVDVTVTDAHGNPVHGLTQADFTPQGRRQAAIPAKAFASSASPRPRPTTPRPNSRPTSTPTSSPRPPPARSTSSSSTA
jgi:hypothetical protein